MDSWLIFSLLYAGPVRFSVSLRLQMRSEPMTYGD
jgi:hypothetical protein